MQESGERGLPDAPYTREPDDRASFPCPVDSVDPEWSVDHGDIIYKQTTKCQVQFRGVTVTTLPLREGRSTIPDDLTDSLPRDTFPRSCVLQL